ncbi:MAG: type II toxin-antitoxin system mRNA interferase toxin, RelE/StbE family [Atopobiaceae bacterium]|nr:type II toxin-antitoxin system mRNA interferase toxin, RelE/StbE family [Atopobiaceae bacterium]
MAYQIIFEPTFKSDYKHIVSLHPQIKDELYSALKELEANGRVPSGYNPHLLVHPGGNYTGHMEFHLAEGRYDVIVIYQPHHTNPSVRMVRMGKHEDLFQGPTL